MKTVTTAAGYDDIRACLAEVDPAAKSAAVMALWARVEAAGFDPGLPSVPADRTPPGRPGRPELVDPRKVPRRRLGSDAGRAALVHAIAHIEFNAINLALDAAWRFRDMPDGFVIDWLSVAWDEARHFTMLAERLAQLGHAYGDFPAHNGLWQMAERTMDDPLERMALVPRVLEARGLDVTPGMIERLREAGDDPTIAALEVILEEEVRHVEIGSRWFDWCCGQAGVDPETTFLHLLRTKFAGRVKGPFNVPARMRAGFSERELAALENI
ncbi:ferritin-like domain-containing protein [Marinihelvus fidelis]|uniref:Ferritin-like domain-containing protein n=1 Tax=Marinihelvus fidelis TaxID=2613842 RepID=A0A5N0TEA1_9GAMM|nr:ferritin-like domain-containing protein [Marinihelvus fidelis]KAA9133310.1 ferritin-like domain-containing protein [Marinihelvus fidelis]